MYSIYEDLPRCGACGSSVEPWLEQTEGGLCSSCQDEHASAAGAAGHEAGAAVD